VSVLDGWRLCPRCGAGIGVEDGRVECSSCGFVAYANPAPTACALCVDDQGRLLLARRAHPPYEGRWDTPGGFLEEGEHPLDCLRRELREETGLDVEAGRFFGVWMDRYSEDGSGPWTVNLYWLATVQGGEPRAADDVSELRWFGRDELPAPEELAFENVAEVLRAWRDEQP
jgi:ADP-ribose pyrophosphatase YjhB (NUDIX family)